MNTQKNIKTRCYAITKAGTRCKRNAVNCNFGVCNQHKSYFDDKYNKFNIFDPNLIDSDEFRGLYQLIKSVVDEDIKHKWEDATQYTTEEHATALKEDKDAFFTKFDNHITEIMKTHPVIIYNSVYKEVRENADKAYFLCEMYKQCIFNINTFTGDKFEVRINSRKTRKYRDLKREIIKQCFNDDRLNINISVFIEGQEEEFSKEKLEGVGYEFLQFHHYEELVNNAVFCLQSTDKRPDTKEGGIFKVGDKIIYRENGHTNYYGVVVKDDRKNKDVEIYGNSVLVQRCKVHPLPKSIKVGWTENAPECEYKGNGAMYVYTTTILRCDRWDKGEVFDPFFNGEWVDHMTIYNASFNRDITQHN